MNKRKHKTNDIQLGTLGPFEYYFLRWALQIARRFCLDRAHLVVLGRPRSASPESKRLRQQWLDRASEVRALEARFLKRGRR